MSDLTRFLDDTPRIRLLEALSKAGRTEFTRADLAREAGQWRATVNRTIRDLERDGIVVRRGTKTRPTFAVNSEAVSMRLLAYFEAALRMASRREGNDAQAVLDGFQQAIQRTIPPAQVRVGQAIVPIYAELRTSVPSHSALSQLAAVPGRREIKTSNEVQGVDEVITVGIP